MSVPDLALASWLALASTVAPRAASQPDAAPAPSRMGAETAHAACGGQRVIDAALVRARIDDLMRAEGLPPTMGSVAIRPMELDGNPNTLEALVDVFSPASCLGGGCPTLVVQQRAPGSVASVGRGIGLYPLAGRTNGWIDLANASLWPASARILRFVGTRYA